MATKDLYIVEKQDAFVSRRWESEAQFEDFYEAVKEAIEISKRYTKYSVRIRVFDVGLQEVVMTLEKHVRC